MACTTLLVGKNASYDGSNLVARNEDSASGVFTPKKFKKEVALEDYTSFSVIKIDPANKEEIRRELELLGITEGFVYPDIEHQSKALLNILNNDN